MAAKLTTDACCAGHLDRKAIGLCDHCRLPFCTECRVEDVAAGKDFCSEGCQHLHEKAMARKTCPRCSQEIQGDVARCEHCGERVGKGWRVFSAALAALVIAAVIGGGLFTWRYPGKILYLPGLLLALSSVALAVGIVGRSRRGRAYVLILILLGSLGAGLWLTRHPESAWLAEVERWPATEALASWLETVYPGSEPGEQRIDGNDGPIEIVYLAPGSSPVSQPGSSSPRRTHSPAGAEPPPPPVALPPEGIGTADSPPPSRPDSTVLSPANALLPVTPPEVAPPGPLPSRGGVPAVAPLASAQEEDDPEVREHLRRGFDLMGMNRNEEAVRAFKKADKLASGTSAEALVSLCAAYIRIGAYANAERTARRALDLEQDDTGLDTQALLGLGVSIYHRAGKSQERLEEAEATFRAALQLNDGDLPVAKYNLGEVLLKLGRDGEGLDFLEEYLSTDPRGPHAARTRSLVDDPRRAREKLVPNFSLVTVDGEHLTPEDLVGRVVLFDFWGTWCGPCRAATSHLVRLNRRLRGKPFVLIGINTDSDRDQLLAYVEKHKMDWPEVWDELRTACDVFRVRTFPTYLIVDHEGRVVFRRTGWSNRVGYELDREVGRIIRQAVKAQTEQGK